MQAKHVQSVLALLRHYWLRHTPGMKIHGIDHFNIRTSDLNRLVEFYTEALGFEVGDRPSFDSPGAWLYVGGHPLLHVGIGDAPSDGNTQPFDHLAFSVSGLQDTINRLESAAVEYQLCDVPDRAMKQVFVVDPDGIKLELNFSEPEDIASTA